jgi:hypothetical protein
MPSRERTKFADSMTGHGMSRAASSPAPAPAVPTRAVWIEYGRKVVNLFPAADMVITYNR